MAKTKFNFKATAEKQVTLSTLMRNREQLSTDEVIANNPKGFTLEEFDIAEILNTKTGALEQFTICTIKKDPEHFFYGGMILTKICLEWLEAFGGDVDETNRELIASGGVDMKMYASKSKNGNNLTKIDIL